MAHLWQKELSKAKPLSCCKCIAAQKQNPAKLHELLQGFMSANRNDQDKYFLKKARVRSQANLAAASLYRACEVSL